MRGYLQTVLPTRAELLAIRRRIALAQRAHNLLKLRRDALMLELVRTARKVKPQYDLIESRYNTAADEVLAAIIMEGTAGVALAAFSVEEIPTYTIEYRNVIGLKLPHFLSKNVKKSLDDRGYGLLGTSTVIDNAADACEDLVEVIIRMAELRVQVLLLIKEIYALGRRVNALEKILLPELKERENNIVLMRDEREREDFNRIFLIKKKKSIEEQKKDSV
jgi:V/A-type H+/Na+-transporting ATPase subunit D